MTFTEHKVEIKIDQATIDRAEQALRKMSPDDIKRITEAFQKKVLDRINRDAIVEVNCNWLRRFSRLKPDP